MFAVVTQNGKIVFLGSEQKAKRYAFRQQCRKGRTYRVVPWVQ